MRQRLMMVVLVVLAGCGGENASPSRLSEAETPDAGFLPMELDDEGRLMATLPVPDDDGTVLRAIHVARLTSGLGSNPLGLDRGRGGPSRILRFTVEGDRLVATFENHRFTAKTQDMDERDAVRQSFAESIVWSGPIADRVGGSLRVDVADLFTQDLFGAASVLSEPGAGSFSLDADRSFVDASGILTFPDNTEIDTVLTFTTDQPGPEVRETAPDPRAVTLTVHHTLARLPDKGYTPKQEDPRAGAISVTVYDYGAPLTEEVPRAYALRHRLTLKEPDDPSAGVAEPIVFYVDRGAPEPVRQALIDGASWWEEAFAAAGFPGAYRVELLPEGAHPADIRYNVIQWVHRQTRGWSYGGAVYDPRTGEMLKGHVILGSQRVRQDRMIFEGLAGTSAVGTGAADDPVELALARIRQLSAHEVGHALGFGHNFAASAADRASVMDYPAPWVIARDDDTLDFSAAYGTGLGAWDLVAARWLYGTEDGDEVIAAAREAGLAFVEDAEGRGVGTAHPLGAVWDNGSDPVAELSNVIAVRRIALEKFGTDRAAEGLSAARLRDVLVPVYLYHRYQTAAAAKSLGGATYAYGRLGADTPAVEIVPEEQQRAALAATLKTLSPAFLDVPDRLLASLTPTAGALEDAGARERFGSRTGPVFDLFTAAETSADISLAALFAAERLERLHQFHIRTGTTPSVDEVLSDIIETVLGQRGITSRTRALSHAVEGRLVAAMIAADAAGAVSSGSVAAPFSNVSFGGAGQPLSIPVRAAVREAMTDLAARLSARGDREGQLLSGMLSDYLSAPPPPAATAPAPLTVPPGSPIGESCWHCEPILWSARK